MEATDLSVSARAIDEEREPMDLDTLNTPAGRLVGVFLQVCPSLDLEPRPFDNESASRQMRDVVINAPGRSGLIARHRLVEGLPYFLKADRDWAHKHLIDPLLADDASSLVLWRAIARGRQYPEILNIIGNMMAKKAVDRRLGRQTRSSLVFSIVVEGLRAFREGRNPAVRYRRIQQMLRLLDDEVRAHAANAIQRYVGDLSKKGIAEGHDQTAAELFRSAAKPFLCDVWPQERSLATPGISRALADLPATAGEAFVEAVETIDRFMVPFDCWSMNEYGLHGDQDGKKALSIIDDESKSRALLKLFDLTIGTSEGAVIPHGLTEALDHIQAVAPHFVKMAVFRRLSTAARR